MDEQKKAQNLTELAVEEAMSMIGRHISEQIDAEIVAELTNISNATNVPPEYTISTEEWAHYADQNVHPLDEPSTPTYPYDSEGCYFKINDDESAFTLAKVVEPSAITLFLEDGKKVVEIKRTGEVVLGEDITPEFAAQEFWTRLAECGGRFAERTKELEDQIEQAKSVLKLVRTALETPEGASLVQHAEEVMEQLCCMEDEIQAFENDIEEEIIAGLDMFGFEESEKPDEEKKDLNKAYEHAMKAVK